MSTHPASRVGAHVGWLATAALATAMLAHALGLISPAGLDHVGLLSLGWAVFRLARGRDIDGWYAAAAAVGLAGGLALVRQWLPDVRYMPYLLIVPVNLAIAWLFTSGLRPGRQPILLQLVDLMGVCPADDPLFRRFIARQCVLWAALSLAAACLAATAMVAGASHPRIAELLAALFGIQAVWFVLSHHYASFRYSRPEGWWTTARAMMRPEIWSRLRSQ